MGSTRIGRLGAGAVLALTAGALMVSGCTTTGPYHAERAGSRRIVCSDFDFPIYFEKGSDQLSPTARQAIASAADHVKGCRIGEVEVLGLADADGPRDANMELSRRRANVVAQALSAAGLPAPVFDVDALGKLGSRYRGVVAPVRRKTDVVIHAS